MTANQNSRGLFALLVFLLLIPAACQKEEEHSPAGSAETGKVETTQSIRATAALKATEGNQATGAVTFETTNGKVRVVADLNSLPEGKHGFHIHEKGDCSAPDASSAGAHFNPTEAPHGAPDNPAEQRHAGDLGNVEADAEGKAHYERTDPVITLEGPDSIVGKAVIIHARADDMTSQPTGNAGPRLACGVLRAAGETE